MRQGLGMGTTAASWESGQNADRELAPATPMMRQYLEIKALHPDTILFFRLGDFYEMFFEDAVKGSELLQITLTSRSKGDERVPMCGVPYHSARRYIAKLIESGLKVAICDQMEEAGNGPGIVKREVTRIITPGTVLDEDALEARVNNFLASIVPSGGAFGSALLDPSTGELISFECESLFELKERLGQAEPRELLVSEEELPRPWVQELAASLTHRPSLTSIDRGAFDPARAAAFLKSHFRVASLEGFGLGQAPRAVAAAGGALRYLKNTQKTDARHVDRIQFSHREDVLVLDESTPGNPPDRARRKSRRLAVGRAGPHRHWNGRPKVLPLVDRAAEVPSGDQRAFGRGRGIIHSRPLAFRNDRAAQGSFGPRTPLRAVVARLGKCERPQRAGQFARSFAEAGSSSRAV